MNLHQRITGCLLGTAVGDALGLPREGLSHRRAARLFGPPPLRHALCLHRGLCSDDTEHTVMLARALIQSPDNPARFARLLANQLRWWLVRVPAGIGLATLRACVKLWLGFGPEHSGIHSAGNGPAMRSALIGLFACDADTLGRFVTASTTLTHTDPRALQGATIIAAATHHLHTNPDTSNAALRIALLPLITDSQLRDNTALAFDAADQQISLDDFSQRLGCPRGITGFVNHTVPAALFCWLAHRDSFRDAVESAVLLGGDTDTVAAITGALAGTDLGPDAIPAPWLADLCEWPCSVSYLWQLADMLATVITHRQPLRPPPLHWPALLARNFIFTLIILFHALRRLLPPY